MPLSPLGFMDASFNIARALIDASRRIVIAGDPTAPGVPVTLTPQPFPVAANADKLFGYGATVGVQVQNNAHPAGNLLITSGAVPANTVWVLDNITGIDITSATTTAILQIRSISTAFAMPLTQNAALAANTYLFPTLVGPFRLGAGEALELQFTGTLLNDDCRLRFHGYSMHAT